MNILVTGATGFIGSAVMRTLAGDSAHRTTTCDLRLNPDTDWSAHLVGINAIIHTAARVHVMHETAADPLAEFRRVNVEGTLRLAEQAIAAGVKRFIFISSIKVNGEATAPGKPFTADDTPAPSDAYGQSKLEAEQALKQLTRNAPMELVILRPPLVYGPGVKGNMALLVKLVAKNIPLPLASIENQRSMVARDTLVDLLQCCLTHPAAANQTFLVSDGDDISTPELIRRLAAAMNTRARLFPFPPFLLQTAARLVGKGDMAARLCGSLTLDISKTRTLLAWSPKTPMAEALRQMTHNGC